MIQWSIAMEEIRESIGIVKESSSEKIEKENNSSDNVPVKGN